VNRLSILWEEFPDRPCNAGLRVAQLGKKFCADGGWWLFKNDDDTASLAEGFLCMIYVGARAIAMKFPALDRSALEGPANHLLSVA